MVEGTNPPEIAKKTGEEKSYFTATDSASGEK
jgi:hypothetical protein